MHFREKDKNLCTHVECHTGAVAGAGGTSYAIMARQGAVSLKTKNTISFAAGEESVIIGDRIGDMGLVLDDGRALTYLNVWQSTGLRGTTHTFIDCNPVTVGNETFIMDYSDFESFDKGGIYNITLNRTDATKALTIPAGTKVSFNGCTVAENNYCNVYLMGANDCIGTQASAEQIDGLIARYKTLIAHQGSERYLIVMPYWIKHSDAAFTAAFGDHAICFRALAVEDGLTATGLTPTTQDMDMLRDGWVPAALRYNQVAGEVHFNEHGYRFLAKVVYDQGKKLGYWD